MIKVVTNSKGSGDWITVLGNTDTVLFSNHSVTARDLVDIISVCSDFWVQLVEVTDEELEEYC